MSRPPTPRQAACAAIPARTTPAQVSPDRPESAHLRVTRLGTLEIILSILQL